MHVLLFAAILAVIGGVITSKVRRKALWIWVLFGMTTITSAAIASFFAGVLVVQARYVSLPKERQLIAHGMDRMEKLMNEGNSNRVLFALQAYNRTLEGSINNERSYAAAVQFTIYLNKEVDQ
jgi:hypothetical protein